MKLPPPAGQSILAVIVRHLSRFVAGRPQSYLGYKEVCDELNLKPPFGVKWGQYLSDNGLADLAIWAKAEGHPAVTGLIVDQGDFRPREGYFRVYGKADDDEDWWKLQVAEALTYNWKQFLIYAEPPLPPPPPIGSSVAEPPERELVTIYRVVRDTEMARRVKLLHKYKCQLCETRLELKDGSWYAEAHHVHPLGLGGPDDFGNIMCVCPNCHALLDHGAIALDAAKMKRAGHHEVGQEFITYHNEKIHGG